MTPEAFIHAALSFRRGGPVTVWESCLGILDRLGTDVDVVAVTPPGSYLARRLRDAIDGDHLFLHTPAELHARDLDWPMIDEAQVPTVLSDRDRDRPLALSRAWPLPPVVPRARLRRLDTLYADNLRVGLLVLDCPASAEAVLRGAAGLLKTRAPAVVLEMAAAPVEQRLALWDACIAATPDYDWTDEWLLPCADAARRQEALTASDSTVSCGLPRGAAASLRLPDELIALLAQKDVMTASLAWRGWQDRIPIDTSRGKGLSVDFDSDLPVTGFHRAETDGDTWWRWSGPIGRAAFVLPMPSAGSWRLRFDIFSWGVVKQPSDMQVYAMGQCLTLLRGESGRASYAGLKVPPQERRGDLVVDVLTPRPRRLSNGDARLLGVNLARCTLERES